MALRLSCAGKGRRIAIRKKSRFLLNEIFSKEQTAAAPSYYCKWPKDTVHEMSAFFRDTHWQSWCSEFADPSTGNTALCLLSSLRVRSTHAHSEIPYHCIHPTVVFKTLQIDSTDYSPVQFRGVNFPERRTSGLGPPVFFLHHPRLWPCRNL
jgi:hypothetical protein